MARMFMWCNCVYTASLLMLKTVLDAPPPSTTYHFNKSSPALWGGYGNPSGRDGTCIRCAPANMPSINPQQQRLLLKQLSPREGGATPQEPVGRREKHRADRQPQTRRPHRDAWESRERAVAKKHYQRTGGGGTLLQIPNKAGRHLVLSSIRSCAPRFDRAAFASDAEVASCKACKAHALTNSSPASAPHGKPAQRL